MDKFTLKELRDYHADKVTQLSRKAQERCDGLSGGERAIQLMHERFAKSVDEVLKDQ